MKAVLGDTILAEADRDDLISIEGNASSPTPYACAWKGACQYLTVNAGEVVLKDRAWSYPDPLPGSIERVGRDFSGYVAFWKEVSVIE